MRQICYLLILITACTAKEDKDTITYLPFSKNVIHINLANNFSDSLSISALAFTNIPHGVSESNSLTVNSAGDYYLNMEIDRPVKSVLTVDDQQFNVLLFPQDTAHVKIDFTKGKINLVFYGKAKTINEYYYEKQKTLGYTDVRFPLNKSLSPKSTYNSLKQSTDSVINKEIDFLESYTSSYRLPEWFLNYERSEITYTSAGYKTAMPLANEVRKYFDDAVPEDYFNYLSNVQINNVNAILSSQYFLFLDAYFLKSLPASELHALTGYSRINRIKSHNLNQSKDQLSGLVQELYHKSSFSSLIAFYSDSLAIDSVAKEFQLVDYEALKTLSGTKSRNEMPALNLSRGDTIPEFFLSDGFDNLVSIRAFQDKILYVNFWATWCGPCINNMPALNNLISQYGSHQEIQFVNICVESEKVKWLASIKKYKLSGINLIAEGNWNSKLRSYFNIEGIPHYVIIGRGNILYENATKKAPDVQEEIEALLTRK
ncbi:MAG TPA: TlpA disulfide reductase family protein [Chryseolinea sp.]|nr:TlpA disulfide reductase family protein [Chryseolinea sp.]